MEKTEFIALGQKIYGKSGWQKQLAAGLGMSPVTINRYAKGGLAIPSVVSVAMKGLEVTHER